ncbi:hypothetical protein Q9L58_009683 [Maublancomyces gigas]|uniref:Uncharacterized protein n=1 Tax=Discina gigas TaxID=1032678 RepID=A0ABR3G796_9PEZI
MENETRSASGTKRPTEPGPDPEVQPRQTSTGIKRITLRISSIPIRVTKGRLLMILEGLTPFRNPTDEAKRHRGTNIDSLSLAPSSSVCDSDAYQVATVTFKEIPTALAGCVSSASTIIASLGVDGGGEEIEVDVDSHFRGLTPLNHLANPSVDVIAVTGLAGHAFGSWRSRNTGKMWLRDMIPIDLPNARILTYGYDTTLPGSKSNAQISEYANQFLESLKDARHDPHRPIIFIGHSLGGLLIKEVRSCA